MSWHYLPELEVGFSAPTSLVSPPSAPWKKSPTVEKCSSDANGTACCLCSRSGTTFGPSTADPGVKRWISSLRASRASLIQQQAAGGVSPRIFWKRPFESSKKFSLNGSSWRMCNALHSEPYRPGQAVPPSWVPRISANDTGFLPTMTTRMNQQSPYMRRWPAYERLWRLTGGARLPLSFWEWMMGWPIGWSGLEPLATDRFQQWSDSFGKVSE